MMKTGYWFAGIGLMTGFSLLALVSAAPSAGTSASPAGDQGSLDRGRYLVQIGGCNDCHTAGYAQAGGAIPESQWLTGDRVGWRGPWGTTYPPNLRLYVQSLSEETWVDRVHTLQARPPMPWWALHVMSTEDTRALYRFISSLGPQGENAPAFVPPDQEPQTPYIDFTPRLPR